MNDLDIHVPDKESDDMTEARFNTVSYHHEKRRKFDRQKRLSIINGHLYNLEVST